MRAYRAVIVDMLDTLVNFENRHLPVIEIDGHGFRSTNPYVYPGSGRRQCLGGGLTARGGTA
jgi:hypothetical protein